MKQVSGWELHSIPKSTGQGWSSSGGLEKGDIEMKANLMPQTVWGYFLKNYFWKVELKDKYFGAKKLKSMHARSLQKSLMKMHVMK